MGIKSEQEAIDDVLRKYAAKIRQRGLPFMGTRNQGLASQDDVELETLLREALEELAFELRPG